MQPTEATEFIQQPVQRRRHQDPPQLWWRLGLSSLLMHGLLVAIAYPLIRLSISQAGQQGNPLAVETIDPSEINWAAIDARTAAQQAAAQPQTSAPPAEAPAEPAPGTPPVPEFAPVPDFAPPPDETAIAPLPPINDFPVEEPPPTLPTSSNLPAQPPAPDQTTPPSTVPRPPAPDQTTPPENGNTGSDSAASGQPPIVGGTRIGQAPPTLPQPPTAPTGGGGTGTEENLPPTQVDGRVSVSSSYGATLTSTPIETQTDPAAGNAIPQTSDLQVSTNPLDPSYCPLGAGVQDVTGALSGAAGGLESSLGAVVTFRVVVGADGTISREDISSDGATNVSEEYMEFLKCALSRWRFTPAYSTDATTGEQRPRADNLSVTIQINRSN